MKPIAIAMGFFLNFALCIATVCVPQTPCIIPPTVSKIRGVMDLHFAL